MASRNSLSVVVALTAAVVLMAGGEVSARPKRVAQIPNGSISSCANCHINPAGGGARNAFGQLIEADFLTVAGFAGDVVWGPDLAALDADGDGATNGEEMQDVSGNWQIGDADPGDSDLVTQVWNVDSFPAPPEPTPTAVAASTWAQVKAAAQALLD